MANTSSSSNKYLGRSSRECFLSKPDIPHMMHTTPSDNSALFELQELDLYSSVVVVELDDETNNKSCPSSKIADPSIPSLPINIPDWSKYRQNRGREEVAEDVGDVMVPPHEFLAKTRRASMSVQEGIGRTLKGRDLRRLRNSVWAKTGFQD
ncbi:hypothetical protein K1719_040965 [Acacia pycnantha]|nr:hypothetical protein K1719_040965 [Acacia pycnantha]